jgi:beta-xylosidase
MEKVQNPMLWADVPDPDVIRVDDTFYLVSTTMHLMPGAPIMKSKDLKNWETVGSHVYAPGRHRREVCYRADDIHGPWEKQVILESEFGGFSYEAQGTIVDTKDGDWYGIIFQDRGGVGRVLTLMPCRWINGWPMLGDENGKVPDTVRALKNGEPKTSIVNSDDFENSKLGLHWQWNHNPIDNAWSLTERPGFLRLKTSRVVPNIYLAPNSLTQRMMGPTSSASVCIDLSHLKDGDCAGFAAFNSDSGLLTVKKKGKRLVLEMSEQKVELTEREKAVTAVEEKIIESVDLKQNKIWLRIDADFRPIGGNQYGGNDLATFYYSLDGEQWTKIGSDYKLTFDWRRFFMGSKFTLFCYATKKAGGYADFDNFTFK